MVAGTESPFDELTSLRTSGCDIAKSDTPAFFWAYSDNNQTESFSKDMSSSIADFHRLVLDYFATRCAPVP